MRILLVFVLSCLPVVTFASSDYTTKVKLIQGSYVDAQELRRWQSDLLFPHLYEQWLEHNIQSITLNTANAFLNKKNYAAAQWFFRPLWREELVRRQEWTIIANQFKSVKDPALICHYFEALQHLNKPIPTEKLEKLWDSGQSRPDHCDPFLVQWIDQQPDRDNRTWDRQLKAFYARNGKLVRYLNRFYSSSENQQLGQFLTEIYADPKNIISQSYKPANQKMHEIALAAVNRMAFQDPRSASNLWLRIVKVTPGILPQEVRTASRYLGIAMAKQALPEAFYWLTIADPKRSDEEVQHWRLQIALSQQDYHQVMALYQELDSTLKTSSQWRYWMGLSQLKLNGTLAKNNPLIALSKQRLYYGYLAAGVLGVKPSLNIKTNYPVTDELNLSSAVALQRAKALFLAEDITRAQVEWNLYLRNQSNDIQQAAAELALSWGWYAKASQSAGWSGRYDLIHLRYPQAFDNLVDSQAKKLNIPAYWVYGVMRQESRYEHSAISPAGALGLMQIMPATAKLTASKYKLPYSDPSDLHIPETNIAIGSHYLNELYQRFGHPVFATAAYNAGPSRVNTWRNRFPNDITVWIESIPFNETRNYVKSVLAYSQIYALTQQTDWRLASWTNPVDAFASVK